MFKSNPKIDITPNATDRKIILAGRGLVALHFILVLSFFYELPDTIATHFNLAGKADGFGSKNDIWAMPLLNLIMFYGMTLIATKMKPWNYNYPTKVTEKNAPILYAMSIRMLIYINLIIALLFLIISLHTILLAKGITGFNIGWLIILLVVTLTIGPFFYMYKMFKVPK